MKRVLLALAVGVGLTACGSESSPTAPTTQTTPTITTKVIGVSGDLAFGNVNLGSSADRTFAINNTGNATLTYTSLTASGGTGTAGYTASPATGTVAPGATQTVNVHFAPTIAQFYSNVLTVVGDQTSGSNAINLSGMGVNNTPLFTESGSGNTVFDMPTTVARVHIIGDYTGAYANFMVRIGGGSPVVNVILGTSEYANSTHYDATALTTGGVVSITDSDGVSWSFTEVR